MEGRIRPADFATCALEKLFVVFSYTAKQLWWRSTAQCNGKGQVLEFHPYHILALKIWTSLLFSNTDDILNICLLILLLIIILILSLKICCED